MVASVLDDFVAAVGREGLNLYGVRVSRPGAADAVHFWRSDDPVCVYSGAKTFAALGVLRARDEGLLGLDDLVLDHLPAHRSSAAPGAETLTLRHLLHMQSGKGHFWFAGPDARRRAPEWLDLFFADPQKHPPGTKYFYSNACTYVLSRVVESRAGLTLRDYLVPRVFGPLGIDNPQWHTCPGGHTLGATQLHLTNEEYSRLGLLLLQNGVWDGRIVVEASSLVEMTSELVVSGGWGEPESDQGYGLHLWRCTHPGVYRADGKYGQFCVVFPREGAVVTITAHEERRPNDILRLVYRHLVPRLA